MSSISNYVVDKVIDSKINVQDNSTLNFDIKENASACIFFKNSSGVSTKINTTLHENSVCEMFGMFKSKNHDTNVITNVIHNGKKSKCNQDFRFINKKSTSSFEGKITIPKHITGCESHMLNKNILLDDNSNAFSKPELNINNEDVICTHGCTIGAFDENHLFYLQHRGLTYEEAVEVLVQAFSHKRTKRFYTHQNGKNII